MAAKVERPLASRSRGSRLTKEGKDGKRLGGRESLGRKMEGLMEKKCDSRKDVTARKDESQEIGLEGKGPRRKISGTSATKASCWVRHCTSRSRILESEAGLSLMSGVHIS